MPVAVVKMRLNGMERRFDASQIFAPALRLLVLCDTQPTKPRCESPRLLTF